MICLDFFPDTKQTIEPYLYIDNFVPLEIVRIYAITILSIYSIANYKEKVKVDFSDCEITWLGRRGGNERQAVVG